MIMEVTFQKNVSCSCTERAFRKCDNVVYSSVLFCRTPGEPVGSAFVESEAKEEVAKPIEVSPISKKKKKFSQC